MKLAESLQKAAVERIANGSHADPFAVLGCHGGNGAPVVIRAMLPKADRLEVIDGQTSKPLAVMKRLHPDGLFEARFADREFPFVYRLRATRDGHRWEFEDCYRFPPLLSDLEAHLLGEGNNLHAFDTLGAHHRTFCGVDGVAFAVWAPNARRVSVVGPFNDWDGRVHAMRHRLGIGVWEIFVPHLVPGEIYKFEIQDKHGQVLPLKADPFARQCEHPPSTASVVSPVDRYDWRDDDWMNDRSKTHGNDAPISIYEVHLGSWMRVPEENNRFLTYHELAGKLIPHVREMGFTHIELLPVTEFPFDGSWGYQPIGLYAPTSRFGGPDDFRAFVDACHQAGIGVILDWVPGHFPSDQHGLGLFDGTHLYEHADPRQGKHMDWGTLIYNYGRREVTNYLISNALFWTRTYHLDGLRVDAVASMLYLDYSREDGEWVPNRHGGRENLDAIDFLRRLNEVIYDQGDGAFTIAEESTSWPMVSRPTYLGGLGFGYKWNMGWMHDTLDYISQDPVHRRYHHDRMTFGMLYAFSENFLLPLSHDEVTHGKGSILGRMPGDRWQRFANIRAYYGFMFTYPGKKLLFMGCEFAQENEWNHDQSLDWNLLEDPLHDGVCLLVRDLNRLYRGLSALHKKDCEADGFEWVECQDVDQSVFAYLRRGADEDWALVVCNFTPVVRRDYRLGVPVGGFWREMFNSDDPAYGGAGTHNDGGRAAEDIPWHGRQMSLCLTLPPLSTSVFSPGSTA